MSEPSISNFALLRVMVLKEIRTTFRERSQMLGLVVAVIMLFVIVTASLLPALAAMRLRESASTGPSKVTSTTSPTALTTGSRIQSARQLATQPSTQSATQSPTQPVMAAYHEPPPIRQSRQLRLIAVGVVGSIGFFFSCGYLFAATLATFVGEKEAKTLEILLASPLSDRKLYVVKCISVLLPSLAMAIAFSIGVSVLLLVLVPHHVVEHSVQLVVMAVLLSIPAIALFQLWFVGIGAAISARTETMKGAGQVLGVVFLILIFSTMYGLPLLATLVPAFIAPVMVLVKRIGAGGFAMDYLLILLVLAVPATMFIGIGRWSFQRDRMLT
jgi:ABC-type Na+ efflux pump permease subunit